MTDTVAQSNWLNQEAPNHKPLESLKDRDVIYIQAPEGWGMERIAAFEQALNARERNQGTNIGYRIFPYGVKIHNQPADQVFISKAIVRCVYCGQHGARGCECKHCGAPIV